MRAVVGAVGVVGVVRKGLVRTAGEVVVVRGEGREVLGSDSGIVERVEWVGEGRRVREDLVVVGDLVVVVVVVGEAARAREDLAVVVVVEGCCWWSEENVVFVGEAMGFDHEMAGAGRRREDGSVEDGMGVFSE